MSQARNYLAFVYCCSAAWSHLICINNIYFTRGTWCSMAKKKVVLQRLGLRPVRSSPQKIVTI